MFEQLRKTYLTQLEHDPQSDFGGEFIRTTNLERRLVDEYGFDAIRLIHDDCEAQLYPLGKLPGNCPWIGLNHLEVPAAIAAVFASLASEVPRLLDTLNDRCRHIYAEDTGQNWVLHYFLDIRLYDGRRYFQIYTGGAPNRNPQPNTSLLQFEWSVPVDLAKLYAVHDGFGPILNSSDLEVMSGVMDPICEDQSVFPEGYSFADLLEFHPDGGGNAQCFYRLGDLCTTVDWDHETWELSAEQAFFDYIDEELSRVDEE